MFRVVFSHFILPFRAVFPLFVASFQVFDDFMTFQQTYGPVEHFNTRIFFVGPNIAEETEVRDYHLYPKVNIAHSALKCAENSAAVVVGLLVSRRYRS